MTETTSLLESLVTFDYKSLDPVKRAMAQRNIIRFVLDMMMVDKQNRLKYLEVLWRIPDSMYEERDRQRLERYEPCISKIFAMAKFSRFKCSAVAIVDESNKYYNQHAGELPLFFLDIFKSAWDSNFKELRNLVLSNDKRIQDLSFLFLMSLDAEKLTREFCQNLIKSHTLYAELVGHALIIEKFKDKSEPLDQAELMAFILSSIYSNACRPISHYYQGIMNRITPEQANSYLLQKIDYRGFSRQSLQAGVEALKEYHTKKQAV
jgi:hypothetical protein